MQDYPPKQENPALLSLEYRPPPPPKKTIEQNLARTYQQPYLQPFYQPFNPMGYYGPQYVPPVVVKNYTIQTDDVTGSLKKLSMVYEDVLPNRKFSPSHTTLSERIRDYQFIRAVLLNNADGNDIDLHGTSMNSICSHVKIDNDNVNPYNPYKHSENPFKGLPYGFLLFKSGYPIRNVNSSIEYAQDSTEINLRIYKMLEGSYDMIRVNKGIHYKYDEWREVAFYEYIRDHILKKNICPNFVNMYGFYISRDACIDYDGINSMDIDLEKKRELEYKAHTDPTNNKLMASAKNVPKSTLINNIVNNVVNNVKNYVSNPAEYDVSNIYNNPISQVPAFNLDASNFGYSMLPPQNNDDNRIACELLGANDPQNQPSLETVINGKVYKQKNLDSYMGKSLVILTESPTYSIIGWATTTYQTFDNVKHEMIRRGYHDGSEWMNIFAQLMFGLYTMQMHRICISNFSLEKNVFVKDLTLKGTVTDYWKYKINGIDYYIPNVGYLVMIDSNFRDLDISNDDKHYSKLKKIKGDIFSRSDNVTDDDLFKMFKNCFTTNAFGNEFKRSGGVQPPDNVMKTFLGRIMNDVTNKNDIAYFIEKYLRQFLHNRIGTYLKENEIQYKRPLNGELKKGQLLIHESISDKTGEKLFKIVMVIEPLIGGQTTILTKFNPSDPDIIDSKVPNSSLSSYSEVETIQQSFKTTENIKEDALLETYIISAN